MTKRIAIEITGSEEMTATVLRGSRVLCAVRVYLNRDASIDCARMLRDIRAARRAA